jgi:5-methylthioadenosine/S-adenosylhomocysteine deaminase
MKRLIRTLSLALLLVPCAAFAGGTAHPVKQRADLIVRGGTLLTMAGPNVENGAVAVKGNTIVAAGPAAAVDAAWTATEVIDAKGGAILPGFVNAHTHVPMTLFRGIADDRDLMDWLTNFIFPAEAKNVDREFVRAGTRLAAAEMILSGTTTFADMYYFEADIAREAKKAGLRCVAGETVIDFPAPDNKTWDEALAYMKKFADEFKGDPLVTAAIAPHAPYTVSEEHLRAVRAFATANGTPILIHVSETEDELSQIGKAHGGRTPGDYLESIGFLGDDVVAAHGVWLTKEEAGVFAKRGTSVVHCPESNMMLASGLAPLGVFAAAGVDVGLGTDGPAGSNNNLDMIEEMATAARLQKVLRKDPKALSARGALELATIGSARALNMADRIGTIEPGKRADIIVMNLGTPSIQPIYSIESAIVYAASGDDVTATIVDGKVLMKDRIVKTVDVKKAIAEADALRDKVVASLKK